MVDAIINYFIDNWLKMNFSGSDHVVTINWESVERSDKTGFGNLFFLAYCFQSYSLRRYY